MHTRNSILPYHQLTAAFTKQSDVCWDHRHTEQGLWKLLLGYKLQNRLEDLNSPAVLRYGTGLGQNCGRSSVGHSLPEPFQMALCYPKHCTAEADKVKKEWLNLNVVKNNLFIFCIQWLRGRLHRHSGLRDKSLGSLRKAFWMVDLSFKSYRIRPVRNKVDILKISKQYTHPGRVSERMFLVSCTAGSIWADTRGQVGLAGSHQAEDRIRQRKAGKRKSWANTTPPSQNKEGE